MRLFGLYAAIALLAIVAVVGLLVGLVLGPLVYGMVRGYEIVADFMDRHSES